MLKAKKQLHAVNIVCTKTPISVFQISDFLNYKSLIRKISRKSEENWQKLQLKKEVEIAKVNTR